MGAAILNFFVCGRVPVALVESPAFIEMLRVLCPAFVARSHAPNSKKLAGPMVDKLYVEARPRVLRLLSERSTRKKAVLILNGWEKVNRQHIVNLLAVVCV